MNPVRAFLNKFIFTRNIHWGLLVFLLLFLDVKLVVKLAAILFIYALQPNFRFGFSFKNPRLPLFYFFVICLAVVNTFLYRHFFQLNYLLVLTFGIGFWMACILAVHQIKLIVEKTDAQIIYQTLVVFFLLNTCVSAFQYLRIVFETGALNPFLYQGNYQRYFISTGDYIKGLSFDTSTTNAVINAFGIIFFLSKRAWLLTLMCTVTLLFTASNLVNLVVFATMLLLFLFNTNKVQKTVIVACFALFVVFMAKVSPQNNTYAINVFEKVFGIRNETRTAQAKPVDVRILPDGLLTVEQRKEKIARLYLDSLGASIAAKRKEENKSLVAMANERPFIPQPSIHSAPFQNRDDTNAYRKELLSFIAKRHERFDNYAQTTLPGKAIAYLQTGTFVFQHPLYLLTGAGLGNFSSKMAFKATALQFAGGFPQRFAYINPNFSSNHLDLYTYFFSKRADAHSVTNSPASVYDQLLGEYGLIGLAAFFLFYIGFFAKHYKRLTYGIPLLFLLLAFFFIDYWFEQLSIVPLFEALLFLNLKETKAA